MLALKAVSAETGTTTARSAMLERLREAGRVAAAARDFGARLIVPGARLSDVCEAVEDEIERRGGRPAFPVQSSRNHVAAHYCPAPGEPTVYAEGDLAKLDVGVHVDGWVVDTALTVNVGDRPENRPLVAAARAALEDALAAVRPGMAVREVSTLIDARIRSFGLNPLHNLCGHGVGRWTVHCAPPIPNTPDDMGARLPVDAAVAIEPFASDGPGFVIEEGVPEVFRLDPARDPGDSDLVLEAVRAFGGLPFARRQIAHVPPELVQPRLAALVRAGRLTAYAPLVERTRRPVAQAEHTVFLGRERVEVLTR
jgi:methionyl aminopeptidase